MSSKHGETKKGSVRSAFRRKFSRKSSKKKEEPKDDIGRRLAMASASTSDFTPGSNVFRADTVDSGRFTGPASLSVSVTSLDDLTASSKSHKGIAGKDAAVTAAGVVPNGQKSASSSREATAKEIQAITKQIVALHRKNDESSDEDDEDDSQSDGGTASGAGDDERKDSEPFLFMNPAFSESDSQRRASTSSIGSKKQAPPKPSRRPGQFSPIVNVADGSPRLNEEEERNASPRPGNVARRPSQRNRHATVIDSAVVVSEDSGGVVRRKKTKPKAEETRAALRRSVSMGSDFFISELGKDSDGERDYRQISPLVGSIGRYQESSPTPSSESTASPFASLRNIPTAVVNDIRAEMDALLGRIRLLESENKVLPALRHQVGELEMEKQEMQMDLEVRGENIREWSKGNRKTMSSSMVSLQLLQDENRRIPDLQQRVVELDDENRQLKREKQLGLVLGTRTGVVPEKKVEIMQTQIQELESQNRTLQEELDRWTSAGENTLRRKSGDDELRRELRELRAKNSALEKDLRRLQKNSADSALLTQVADSAIAKWKESEQQMKALPKLRAQMAKLEEEKRKLEAQVVSLQQQQQQQLLAIQSPARSVASSPTMTPLWLTPSGSSSSLDGSSISSPSDGSAYQLKLMDDNMKLKKTAERLRGECAGLAQSVNTLKGHLASERQTLGGQLESVKREMSVEREQWAAENNRLKQQNRRLLMDRWKVKTDETTAAKLKAENERAEKLEAELVSASDRLRETEEEMTELRSLRDALDDVFVRMTELQRTCRLPDSQVDSVAHAAEVIEETQSRLQAMESRCLMLEGDQEQARCAYDAAQAEVDATQEKMHDYIEELTSLERRLHDGNRSMSSMTTENQQLNMEKHELLETVRGLRMENSSLWQKTKDLEEQKKGLQNDVESATRSLDLEEKQLSDMKMDFDDSEVLVGDLKEELKLTQGEKRVLESRLHYLESTADEKHRLSLELKEQEVILAVQEKFQRQLLDVEMVVEERRKAMDEHFNYLEEVNAEKTQKSDELQKMLTVSRNQCAELEEQLASAKTGAVARETIEKERRAFEEEKRKLTDLVEEKSVALNAAESARRSAEEKTATGEEEIRKSVKERNGLAAELEKRKTAQEAEVNRLEEKVKEMRESLTHREAESDRLSLEGEKRLRETEAAFEAEIAQRELRMEQLQSRIDELQSELPAAGEETKRLREAVDGLQVQLNASEGRLVKEQKTNGELEADVERLSHQLDKEKREKSETVAALEGKEKETRLLGVKIQMKEEEWEGVQKAHDEACERVTELANQLEEMGKEKEKASALEKQLEDLDARLEERTSEVDQLTTSLRSVSSRVGDLEKDNSGLTDSNRTLEGKIDEMTSFQGKAVQLASEQRETVLQLQEKGVEMRRRLQQYEDETVPRLKEETLVLEKEKLDMEGQLQLLEIKLNGLEEEAGGLKAELDEVKKMKGDVEAEKRELERHVADLKGKGEQLDSALKSLRENEKRARQLEDAKAALEEDSRHLRARIVALQKNNEDLEEEVANLRSEGLEEAKKAKEKQDRAADELKATKTTSAKQIEELERSASEKEAGMKAMEAEKASLEERVKELVAEVESRAASVEEAAIQMQSEPTETARFGLLETEELKLLRSENRLMKDKVELLEESVEQSRGENRQIQIVIDEMEKNIPAITEKNSKLQDENKMLRQRLHLLTEKLQDIKELDQEKLQLEWKLEEFEQQLPVIRQQKKLSDVKAQEAVDLAKKCQMLEMQVDDLQEDISVQRLFSKQVPLLQEQCKFKQKEVRSFEGEVKMLHREIRELELEIAVWKQKNQELNQDQDGLMSDVRELKLANQNLMLLVDQDKHDHAERGAQDISTLKQVIAELEQDNQQLQKRLDEYGTSQRRLKEESKELVHLNDLVLELEEENNKLQSRREKDRRKMDEQSEKLKALKRAEETFLQNATQVESLKAECVSVEAHVADLLKENEQLQSKVNRLQLAVGSGDVEATTTVTSKTSRRRASTPERGGVVTALGGRIKELETQVEELMDELARVKKESTPTSPVAAENGEVTLRRRRRTDESRGELDRLPKRLSFLPDPEEELEGQEDFAVAAGISPTLKEACKDSAEMLDKDRQPETAAEISNVNTIKRHWFTLTSTVQCSESEVKKWVKALAQISHNLLKFVVNCTDGNGNTALHYLVSNSNFPSIEILLDTQYCEVNLQNAGGYTPIMLTAPVELQGHADRRVLRKLYLYGDVNVQASRDGQTALMLTVTHGNVEIVKLLLAARADASVQDVDGSTALMCACEHGHEEIARLLLAQPSCNVNARDNDGSTALQIAMETPHEGIATLLYAHMVYMSPTLDRKGAATAVKPSSANKTT
eukprot:m.19471 g.19471  ORF g.19471 m.19471 type:complete len:2361 (+) comp27846_c0_seq1:69-7151(+)